MRVLTAIVILACPSWVVAQPEPYPEATPAPPVEIVQPPPQQPPPQPPPPPLDSAQYRRQNKQRRRYVHQVLLQTNPEYRDAVSRRNSGIIVASVLGGVGLLVGLVAGTVALVCEDWGGDCDDAKAWTIGGFVAMGVGLAVGIPLAVKGQSRVKEIRAEAMRAPTGALHSALRRGSPTPRAERSARIRLRAWLPRPAVLVGRGAGRFALRWEF